MKYLDEIKYIRRGGRCRNGKAPDRFCTVFFLRKKDDVYFNFLFDKDSDQVGIGWLNDIITVNGNPV